MSKELNKGAEDFAKGISYSSFGNSYGNTNGESAGEPDTPATARNNNPEASGSRAAQSTQDGQVTLGSQSKKMEEVLVVGKRPDGAGKVQVVNLLFGVVDFTLSFAEALTGVGIMIASPFSGPAVPATFIAGLGIAGHGLLGMTNSTLAIKAALYNEDGIGLMQLIGESLFGETGGNVGMILDMYSGIRPGAVAAGTMNSIGDMYDSANSLNTMSNSFKEPKNEY